MRDLLKPSKKRGVQLCKVKYGKGFESADEAMQTFNRVTNGIHIVLDKKTLFRYIIQDFSGKTIDNAQGYGYKTIGNAYRAHKYKSHS